jgi:hypothetical protein
MTRTGQADVVVPAGRRTVPGRRASTRPGSRELVSSRPAAGAPAIVRAVFPGGEFFKPDPGRPPARARRPRPAGPPPRHPRVRPLRPQCSRPPADPLYLYLLKRPAVALYECPVDPGRDKLCILTSPPRWLQWP